MWQTKLLLLLVKSVEAANCGRRVHVCGKTNWQAETKRLPNPWFVSWCMYKSLIDVLCTVCHFLFISTDAVYMPGHAKGNSKEPDLSDKMRSCSDGLSL